MSDMPEELEKTCENCEYEHEDMESTHCRHCIHNAEEHFAPKINHDKEVRNKAIDDFAERISAICDCYAVSCDHRNNKLIYAHSDGTWHDLIYDVAKQLKGEKQ